MPAEASGPSLTRLGVVDVCDQVVLLSGITPVV